MVPGIVVAVIADQSCGFSQLSRSGNLELPVGPVQTSGALERLASTPHATLDRALAVGLHAAAVAAFKVKARSDYNNSDVASINERSAL